MVKLEPYLPAKPLGEGSRFSLFPIYKPNIFDSNIFGNMPNIIDQIYLFHKHTKYICPIYLSNIYALYDCPKPKVFNLTQIKPCNTCLLYTSDAADE